MRNAEDAGSGVSQAFHDDHECPSCQETETRNSPCGKCSGAGIVKIKRKVNSYPAGVTRHAHACLRQGEPGLRGGEDGDLYVVIYVKDQPVFKRDGDDIHCDVPITFSVAALGGDIDIPTSTAISHIMSHPPLRTATFTG